MRQSVRMAERTRGLTPRSLSPSLSADAVVGVQSEEKQRGRGARPGERSICAAHQSHRKLES